MTKKEAIKATEEETILFRKRRLLTFDLILLPIWIHHPQSRSQIYSPIERLIRGRNWESELLQIEEGRCLIYSRKVERDKKRGLNRRIER